MASLKIRLSMATKLRQKGDNPKFNGYSLTTASHQLSKGRDKKSFVGGPLFGIHYMQFGNQKHPFDKIISTFFNTMS